MNVKYGLYIKGRGWIKSPDFTHSKLKCCRNAGDIHTRFILSDKSELTGLLFSFPTLFEGLKYELKEIPQDSLIDKRVVASKKRTDRLSYSYKIFPSMNHTSSSRLGNTVYCHICNLYIDPSEMQSENICIHCLKALYSTIASVYDDMDDEIKKSWERAKLFDEI